MTLEETIQREGFDTELRVSGRHFRSMATGAKFHGLLDPQPAVDPRLDLGSDIREFSLLTVVRENWPSDIGQENLIQQLDAPGQAKWKVVRRDDNPGDICIKAWIVLVTDKDS